MGCFGNSGAAAQREADHLALINRYKAENASLKADVARLEREMTELRSQSADAVRQKEEESAKVQREVVELRSQLGQATDKEGEVAEHTVSLIQEIAELKGRLRAGGAGADVVGGGSGGAAAPAANSSSEVVRLRRELEEAKEEARSYSEEIGDLARQISDFQSRHVETESYRKEIKYLRSKLGDDAGSPDSMSCSSADGGAGSGGDGASGLFGFKGDLLESSSSYGGGSSLSASSSLNSSPIKSARGTFSFDSKNVIQTVSLTSGFFGGNASSIDSDASITMGGGSSKRSAGSLRSGSAHKSKASVVTPREGALPANIDAEVVSNAIKCVEDLIKRVNQSRSKGSSLSAGAMGRRSRSFEEGVEMFDLPASMRGTFDDDVAADCSMSTTTGASRQVPRDGDSSEQNSSFYSAASTKEGAASSPTKKRASSTRSPRSAGTSSGSAIFDTSSWKPVGTTGELLAVSDDGSTIGTLEAGDEYGLDDSGSLYSAYSAPLLTGSARQGSRNESAVIIADLYRVQNLLSSVLEGRPHVKEELQSSLLQPNSFARAAGSRS